MHWPSIFQESFAQDRGKKKKVLHRISFLMHRCPSLTLKPQGASGQPELVPCNRQEVHLLGRDQEEAGTQVPEGHHITGHEAMALGTPFIPLGRNKRQVSKAWCIAMERRK